MIVPEFLRALERERMVRRGDRVLVAVSGGSDSTALLALFAGATRDLGLDLHVAHLDHGWRGQASARDAEFVRRLALGFRLPVTVGHVDPVTWRRPGPRARGDAGRRQSSREARARTLRRRFLEATAAQVGARRIALGHTLDDQAETLLLRLLRGSGRRGLGGIHPVVDGLFIRPLLGMRRADLRAWLRSRRLRWREDATNRDPSLARNRVRRRLLPLLEREFNPRATEVLARAADLLRDEEDWLVPLTDEAYAAAATRDQPDGVILDAERLAAMPRALKRRVVRRAVTRVRGHLRGIDQRHIERTLALLDRGGRRALDLPGGLQVFLVNRTLFVFTWDAMRADPAAAAELLKGTRLIRCGSTLERGLCPVPGSVDLSGFRLRARLALPGEGLPKPGDDAALLDADLVENPLVIRPRRPGDRFHPQGAPGTRRLKEFLIDRKVPVDERGRIPLVLSGERIAWVVGHRIDDRFKLTPATRRVLVLTKETR
jgi:tRNA(Ile)-lysidine synthase